MYGKVTQEELIPVELPIEGYTPLDVAKEVFRVRVQDRGSEFGFIANILVLTEGEAVLITLSARQKSVDGQPDTLSVTQELVRSFSISRGKAIYNTDTLKVIYYNLGKKEYWDRIHDKIKQIRTQNAFPQT